MKVRPSAWFISLLLLAGCPEKETKSEDSAAADSTSKSTSAPAATTGGQASPPNPTPTNTTATTTAAVTPPPPAADGGTPAPPPPGTTPAGAIEPRVKAEVDNKPDGITNGNALTAPGAQALIQVPKEWQSTPGPVTVAKSADGKTEVAVSAVGPEGPEKALPAVATAAGLTNCQWGAIENGVTAGKDKLPASVADGVCNHGAGKAKAAMMAVNGLLVVGAWDDGGDSASMFNAFRSVTKAQTDNLAACCAAIRQNAKSAPPQQAGLYMLAAGTCDSLRKNPNAVAQVRGMLRGLNVPSQCR